MIWILYVFGTVFAGTLGYFLADFVADLSFLILRDFVGWFKNRYSK